MLRSFIWLSALGSRDEVWCTKYAGHRMVNTGIVGRGDLRDTTLWVCPECEPKNEKGEWLAALDNG